MKRWTGVLNQALHNDGITGPSLKAGYDLRPSGMGGEFGEGFLEFSGILTDEALATLAGLCPESPRPGLAMVRVVPPGWTRVAAPRHGVG